MERPLVLVADDDGDILALVSERLKLAGCDVLEASDGKRAYELLVERNPDLAVLDLRMPFMLGDELTRRIRADSKFRSMPVIMLTANNESTSMMRSFELGADDYITKPFDALHLATRVKSMLKHRAAA